MRSKQQLWVVRRIILLIGIAALIAMILRMAGSTAEVNSLPTALSTVVSTSIFVPPSRPPNELEPRVITPGLVEVETLADPWANTILNQVVVAFKDQLDNNAIVSPPQLSAYEGALVMELGELKVGEHLLDLNSLADLPLGVIQSSTPERVLQIGRISVDRGVLILESDESFLSQETREWRLSNAVPAAALRSLIAQAQLRSLRLEVSLRSGPAGETQIDIYHASYTNIPQSPSPIATTPTSVLEISPSPTRMPDIVLGRLLAARIDPVISELHELSPVLTADYSDRYARSGILTATETEIQIAGRSIPIDNALNLTIYGITSTLSGSSTVRLLSAHYSSEGTTRFPEEQVYFQGHRMREILYWMVSHAAEKGGQLVVGYDELAQIQAVTLIGFKEFSEP